jgi:fructokinase
VLRAADKTSGEQMNAYTLIGIGEILWDEFPGSKRLGGAPANFAFHAGQLGGRGMIISSIGDDLPGREIQALLDEHQTTYLLPVDPHHPTGRVSVTTDAKGSPKYLIHENSSWDFLSFEPAFLEAAGHADVVCFGTLAQRHPVSGHTIREFIRATKQNCLKILDVNLRQHYYSKKILSDLLDLTDILKLNQEELDILRTMFTGTMSLSKGDETVCLEELIQLFDLDMIALTRGKNGSRLFVDRQRDSVYSSNPVKVVDTVGAGDSFSAVVALGALKGFSLDRINRLANTVAAFVCSQKGATPILPKEIMGSMG